MSHFQIIKANKITWLHSNRALGKDEREKLINKYGFYEHHVTSTQQGKTPRPKISVTKKYVYIVLHVPYQPTNSNKYFICDLNIYLTKDTLVTVESNGDLPSLRQYFETAKQSKRILERRLKHGSANLMMNMVKYILNDLEDTFDKQGEQVDALNKKIFDMKQEAEFIEKISILRYNQVLAFSAMERQSRMMELNMGEKNPVKGFTDKSNHKWGDIVDTFQTLAYELKADMSHLEGLVHTFETLVTHRTNQTIKILTIFSVVLLPLTLLSGLWGMNFHRIPLAETPFGFYLMFIIMLLIVISMIGFFKWRKWM